jgi:glycosyltransferase involved in cell wall biosynthesis
MPIKVLFVGNYDIPEHNIRPEAEMIIGLQRRGLDIEVMTRADCWYARRMAGAGIRIHDYSPPAKFSLAALRRIRRVLREGRHDVIHLFNNKAIVAGVQAAYGLPVRVVTYRGQTGNISRFDPVAYLTHLSPRVDRIVCVAEAVRQSLLAEVRDPRRLVTIYKGHDLAWYADVVPADLAALGIPHEAFVVTCVANNRPRKGVPVLIDAAGRLPPDSPVHVLLVGSGMDSPEIRRLVDASPQPARLHACGHRDDVLALVAASHATVLPAIKREGLPKTVIESMALEIPPIVTDTGGSPELVEQGDSGLVVPPGDAGALAAAITQLATDPRRALAMGRRARARLAERFTLEASVDAHQRLYEELLQEARKR